MLDIKSLEEFYNSNFGKFAKFLIIDYTKKNTSLNENILLLSQFDPIKEAFPSYFHFKIDKKEYHKIIILHWLEFFEKSSQEEKIAEISSLIASFGEIILILPSKRIDNKSLIKLFMSHDLELLKMKKQLFINKNIPEKFYSLANKIISTILPFAGEISIWHFRKKEPGFIMDLSKALSNNKINRTNFGLAQMNGKI